MGIYFDITKQFKEFNLNIQFQGQKEFQNRIGILGSSGCGKSMTLQCIAGIEKPDSGTIIVNNTILFSKDKEIDLSPQKRKVGYLFQNYALFPNMTVVQNIGIGISEKNKYKKQNLVQEQIKKFQLEQLENRYPSELSGGQQQRVAFARMLAYIPSLILLDEPFSALDSYLKDQLQEQLLETLEGYEGDVIMVSHNQDELYKLCDTMIVMKQGSAIVSGEMKAVFQNPQYLEVAKLTGCKNISRIKKLDDYTLNALEWGIILRTKEKINKEVQFVGIRAHDIEATNQNHGNNVMEVSYLKRSQTPFEIEVFLQNKKISNSKVIWWKCPKQQEKKVEHTSFIRLPEESLMLLI